MGGGRLMAGSTAALNPKTKNNINIGISTAKIIHNGNESTAIGQLAPVSRCVKA